jgi:two-component system sensor kinase FixL
MGGKRTPFDFRLRRNDGSAIWVSISCGPVCDSAGAVVGLLGLFSDISERKRTEENERQLAHMQRLSSLGALVAAMAHELRQPLTSIMANAQAAQSLLNCADMPISELRQIMGDILENDKRASAIISRTVDFVTKRELRIEPLDLNSLVALALQVVGGETRRRRIHVDAELANGLPPVLADRVRVQQILVNLMLNAVEAMANTPETEHHLTIRTRANDAGEIEIAVIDQGSGIPAADFPRVFEPFFSTKTDGIGLGLSISQSIVALHRGRIWAENMATQGAAFYFTLPIAK